MRSWKRNTAWGPYVKFLLKFSADEKAQITVAKLALQNTPKVS